MLNYREKKILELINEFGEVKVKDLAKLFQVSEVTIRRDLQSLEERELLVRTHGGAQQNTFIFKEVDFDERLQKNIMPKKLIATEAIKFIKDNSTIYLDAGSTIFELVKLIVKEDFNNLTIVTNDLHIANYVHKSKKYPLIMLGGKVNQDTGNTEGYFTRNMLNNIFVDIAFIGTSCISKDLKMYTPNEEKVDIKRAYFNSSNKTILLADETKFNNQGMYFIANVSDVDVLITDKKFTTEQKEILGNNIEIINV